MFLVRIKGVSKRQKKKKQITVEWFHRLIKALPEPLNIMVIVDGCLGLRISELVALKWEDIDSKVRTIMIQRKFTHGKLGKTKTDASEAGLPLAKELFEIGQSGSRKPTAVSGSFLQREPAASVAHRCFCRKEYSLSQRRLGWGTSRGTC